MHALVEMEVQVTVGVDTHADVHVAAAVDQLGRLVGTHSVPTTPAGMLPCSPGQAGSEPWDRLGSRARAAMVRAWRGGCAAAVSR